MADVKDLEYASRMADKWHYGAEQKLRGWVEASNFLLDIAAEHFKEGNDQEAFEMRALAGKILEGKKPLMERLDETFKKAQKAGEEWEKALRAQKEPE